MAQKTVLNNGWFKKGHIPWCKGTKGVRKAWNKGKTGIYLPETLEKNRQAHLGRKHSEESKAKIGLASKGNKYALGNKLSKETKRKMSDSHKGEKAYQWKGGIRGKNYLERRRFQHILQKKVFERDHYTCQICNKKGGILHVDHIQSFAEYLEGRFDLSNCRTLCVSCHYMITFKRPMPRDSKWGTTFMRK